MNALDDLLLSLEMERGTADAGKILFFFFHIPIVHTYQLRFKEMNVCVLAVSPTKDSMNI